MKPRTGNFIVAKWRKENMGKQSKGNSYIYIYSKVGLTYIAIVYQLM